MKVNFIDNDLKFDGMSIDMIRFYIHTLTRRLMKYILKQFYNDIKKVRIQDI